MSSSSPHLDEKLDDAVSLSLGCDDTLHLAVLLDELLLHLLLEVNELQLLSRQTVPEHLQGLTTYTRQRPAIPHY